MNAEKVKLFTIITPTYNCKSKIKKTIDSVYMQNHKLFEYIVIDGKSNDGTIDEIKKYKNKIDKIIIEKDNGIYDAMNKGILRSNGKYIFFLCGGDTLCKNILDKVSKIIESNYFDFIYGDVYKQDTKCIYDGKFNKFKLIKKNICHQAIFYNRSVFKKLGLYNEKYKYLADYEFNIRCFGRADIKKKYVNDIISYYEGNGISEKREDENFSYDFLKIIKKNLGYYYYFIVKVKKSIKNMINNILGKCKNGKGK